MEYDAEIVLSCVDEVGQVVMEDLLNCTGNGEFNISASYSRRTYISDDVGSRPKLGVNTSGRNHT